jgi:diguanylate cyclase
MSANDSITKRIARWVGSGKDEPPARNGSFARASEQRRLLFDEIGDFLFAHDLDLTPLNFSLASDFLTGNNHRVATAVARRLQSHGKITDSWAEALVAKEQQADLTADTLNAMIARIEANLDDVSGVIDRSRNSATDYGNALAGAAGELPGGADGSGGLMKLLSLTETMIRETRDVEKELRKQQQQVQLLEKNLASARHAADHDHLTGLPNRRAFEARMAEEASLARETGEPLTIAFCDIDHFKQVNDDHGHETGDRVLKLIADILSEISGERCHVARHGGEEFVMLFRNLGTEEVFELVDETRASLSHRNLVNKVSGKRLPPVTFSAGIADILAHEDPRHALKAADQALYLAKRFGRNQVRIATDDHQE